MYQSVWTVGGHKNIRGKREYWEWCLDEERSSYPLKLLPDSKTTGQCYSKSFTTFTITSHYSHPFCSPLPNKLNLLPFNTATNPLHLPAPNHLAPRNAPSMYVVASGMLGSNPSTS